MQLAKMDSNNTHFGSELDTQLTENQNEMHYDYANMRHEDTKDCNNRGNDPDAIAHCIEMDSMIKTNVIESIRERSSHTVKNIWPNTEYCQSVVRNNFRKCVIYAHLIASPCLHLYLTIFTFTYQSDDIDYIFQMKAGRVCTTIFWFVYGLLHLCVPGPGCALSNVFVNTLWLNLGSFGMMITLCFLKENIPPIIEDPDNYTCSYFALKRLEPWEMRD